MLRSSQLFHSGHNTSLRSLHCSGTKHIWQPESYRVVVRKRVIVWVYVPCVIVATAYAGGFRKRQQTATQDEVGKVKKTLPADGVLLAKNEYTSLVLVALCNRLPSSAVNNERATRAGSPSCDSHTPPQ